MANCQGCGTDLFTQDRFCKNCGAPVAASVEDLADTRPFDPSAPRVATAPTGSLDPNSPRYAHAASTYPIPRSSGPLHLSYSLIKTLLGQKMFLLLGALLLLLFIGTGAIVGREMVRSRRAQRAEQARDNERAKRERQKKQAEATQRASGEAIQNAMGFVPADLVPREYPDTQGVFVNSLTGDESPAAVATIQAGDVLTALGDQPISNTNDLARMLNSTKPGTELAVKLLRDEEPVSARIRIGSQTVPPFQAKTNPRDQGFLGAGDVKRRCCVPGTKKWGVEIHRIIDNSPADLSGLQLGDVITEFDKQAIRTPDELARRIHGVKPRSKVKIKFYRGNTEQTIELIVGHGW